MNHAAPRLVTARPTLESALEMRVTLTESITAMRIDPALVQSPLPVGFLRRTAVLWRGVIVCVGPMQQSEATGNLVTSEMGGLIRC